MKQILALVFISFFSVTVLSQSDSIQIGYGGNSSTGIKGHLRIDSVADTSQVANVLTHKSNGLIAKLSIDSLLSNFLDSTEWVDGSLVGLTSGNIYSRKALLTGDTIVITPDGKLGIQTNNPQQALDVNGNIEHSGALMPGGNAGTSGDVLTSQGVGIAPIWQPSSGISGNCIPIEITDQSLLDYNYKDCMVYCDTITQGGNTDWRFPDQKEVLILFNNAPNNASTDSFHLFGEITGGYAHFTYSTLNIGATSLSAVRKCRCVR